MEESVRHTEREVDGLHTERESFFSNLQSVSFRRQIEITEEKKELEQNIRLLTSESEDILRRCDGFRSRCACRS
jgi:hypothetical protein